MGNVYTLIVRGNEEEITGLFDNYDPALCDMIPLTLEEIFIYELGGENYGIKEIVL